MSATRWLWMLLGAALWLLGLAAIWILYDWYTSRKFYEDKIIKKDTKQ